MDNSLYARLAREKWFRVSEKRCGIEFLFHDAQVQLNKIYHLETDSMLRVWLCARQFGKTFFLTAKAIEHMIQNPKKQGRLGAAYLSDIETFIMPAFEKILEHCPPSIKPVFKTKHSTWVFPNGSKLKLVGLDVKPEGMRGGSLSFIGIDEAAFVTSDTLDYVYTSVIVPATLHNPDTKVIFSSTPPSTPGHCFLNYYLKAESEGGSAKFTIYDNPMLDNSDVLRMAKELGCVVEDGQIIKMSTAFRREMMAEFVVDDTLQVIPEFNKEDHVRVIDRDQYYEVYHKYVSQDLGVHDLTAVIFGTYLFKQATLYIEDEFDIAGPEVTTPNLVKKVQDKERLLWGDLPVYRRISDNNNPHLLQDLGSIHGLHFHAVVKTSVEAMINQVRNAFKDNRIIIHPRCKKLIGCLEYGVWNKKRTDFEKLPIYGHIDHYAALQYLWIMLNQTENPIAADFGRENHTSWLGNVKDQIGTTQTSRALEKAFGGSLDKRRPKIPGRF